MSIRQAVACVVLSLACACAASHTTTVTDTQLARVPAEQLASVQERRLDLMKAQDEVGRATLEVQRAQTELNVATKDMDAAKAETARVQAQAKKAEFNRNNARMKQAQRDLRGLEVKRGIEDAHIRSAQSEVARAEAVRTVAKYRAELASSQLEKTKYDALKRSGDPAVREVSVTAVTDRIERAKKDLTNAEVQLRARERERVEAKAGYAAVRQQFSGTGGAGPAPSK